jgi:hypothetical protein
MTYRNKKQSFLSEKRRSRLWVHDASHVETGFITVAILTSTQLPGATETAVSFQIEKEDHTLGNVLRYFINKKYEFDSHPSGG